MKYTFLTLVAFSAFLIVGCSQSSNGSRLREPRNPVELAQEDVVSFENERSPGPWGDLEDKYIKVFGGGDGRSIRAFVQERVKHFIYISERNVQIDSTSKHTGWNKLDEEEKGKERGNLYLGAINFGMQLWLQSVIDESPATVVFRGNTITVKSPRDGIIILGELYTDLFERNGSWYEVPSGVRKEILTHEARHSDCTGGINSKNLDIARNSKSYSEFRANFPHLECGHLHSVCPSKHALAGIRACDEKPWGAYAVGWLYSEARSKEYSEEWEVMTAVALDAKSRLIYNTQDLLSGKLGEPDMSHSELFN